MLKKILLFGTISFSLHCFSMSAPLSTKPIHKLSPQRVTIENKPLTLFDLPANKLIDEAMLQRSYRVLGGREGQQILTENERVYVAGKLLGKRWRIYRVVNKFTRKDSMETLYGLRAVAIAELAENHDQISGLTIISQQQEIAINDVALPINSHKDDSELKSFDLSIAPKNTQLSILGSMIDNQYLSINQMIVVDRGLRDGVEKGNVFYLKDSDYAIARKELKSYASDNSLNTNQALSSAMATIGKIVITQTYQSFSLAIIVSSNRPIHQGTLVVSSPEESL